MATTVRMTRTACGPFGSFQAGRSYEIDDALALGLRGAGACVITHAPKLAIETATAAPVVETAESPKAKVAPKKRGRPARKSDAS